MGCTEIHDRELIRILGTISLGDRWIGTVEVAGDEVVVRGRDLNERCEIGGTSVLSEKFLLLTLIDGSLSSFDLV